MEKPKSDERYLGDWDAKLTGEWIDYAQTMQTSHCRNINANEKGDKYSEEMFHKIDEFVLMHAFGASTKKGVPHSDIRMNFDSSQRRVAEQIRKKILKYGKTKEPVDGKSYVSIQVISVTLLLVDDDKTSEENIPGVSQVAVFRIVTPKDTFCFIDHTGRYYESWNDYLGNNNLPRCKMCYPKNGGYKMIEQMPSSVDENKNERRYILDLQLSESISCTNWQRFRSGALKVVSCVGLVAGVVGIVAAPFTGGASIGVYATYAAATSGWISFGCMMIGAVANFGSIWDKFWHDESCFTEIMSLAMIILHYGVAKYNAKMIDKLKYKVPVTRTELMLITVLNCTRFAVDSVMFVMTFASLVMKACTEGIKSITALELVRFSMSAYFFGKTVFEPKTGYGIIKEAQQQYVMLEKRSTVVDPGAQKKFDEFVDPEKRFGDGGKIQIINDDWKGITCSQAVCDELNANGHLIRNVNAIDNLNQFFLEVSETNSSLSMTNDGKIMVNEYFKTNGRKLNDFGESKDGINERRRILLEGTALIRQAEADQGSTFVNGQSITDREFKDQMDSAHNRYKQGTDMLKTIIELTQSTSGVRPDSSGNLMTLDQYVLKPDSVPMKLEQVLTKSMESSMESRPSLEESVQCIMGCDSSEIGSMTIATNTAPSVTQSVLQAADSIPGVLVPLNAYLMRRGVSSESLQERVYYASIEKIPIIAKIDHGNSAMIALLNQNIEACIQICKDMNIDWPFANEMTAEQIVTLLQEHQAARGFDQQELDTIVQQRGKKARRSIISLTSTIMEQVREEAKSAQRENRSSKKSGRGEHVINNNVLSVQRDIIDMFLHRRLGKTFGQLDRIPPNSCIYRAYKHPYDAEITDNIQNVMIAKIPDDIFYFDGNALLYGTLIYILRASARDHMIYVYDNPGVQGSPSTSKLDKTRFLMNQFEIYVDQFALRYWLKHHNGSLTIYNRSKMSVYRMFSNLDDQIRNWVHELECFGYKF